MKVKYGEKEYIFDGDLNCLLFRALIDEGIEEVELTLYENVFKSILYNTFNFEEEKDYDTLYQGLSYFGSNKEQELIDFLFEKIYNEERKEFQKEIVDFFELNLKKIDWEDISQNPSLPESFFKKYWRLVHVNKAISNPALSFDFIKSKVSIYRMEKFKGICANPNVPLSFIEENLKYVDWTILSQNPGIPLSFFKKYIDRISWGFLVLNPSIPLSFFKEHINKIVWSRIASNPSIPEQFLEEHIDKVDLSQLIKNDSLSEKFIQKHLRKFNIQNVCMNLKITLKFNINDFNHLWCFANPHISFDFLSKFTSIPNIWFWFCKNPSVPISFFKEHSDKLNWSSLCKNHFNLHKRTLNIMKQKEYFDCKELQTIFLRKIENSYYKYDY